MRLKQKLAVILAVFLLFLSGLPAFSVSAESPQDPATTIVVQDSGIPLEVSEPSDVLPEQGAFPTVSAEKPDADTDQEPPENGGHLIEPTSPKDSGNPEDALEIPPPSDTQPSETPILEPEEQSESPVFSIELVEDGEQPGLYGTLSHIPEDATHITVLYSFSGEDFDAVDNSDAGGDREWDLSGLSTEGGQPKLTQLCVGVNDHPLKAYQTVEENNLSIKLEIKRGSGIIQTEPVKLSHDKTVSIPDTPPTFSANIARTFEGYVLKGTFIDFLPNTSRVRPMYSLDGDIYEPIGGALEPMDWDLSRLETDDPAEQAFLQNQICAYATDEPMKSYLKQGLERFYIKLQITTEAGESYDTQAAVIERGTPQPPLENTSVSANFTASMIAVDRTQKLPYTYGKYQITVRETATTEEVYTLLPGTLPIEVRFLQGDSNEVITSGIVTCDVKWKEPPSLALIAGESFTIQDAANELVLPGGTEVSTPLGIYVLPEAVMIDSLYAHDEIRIVVNPVGAEEKPDISLTGNTNGDFVDGYEPLSLAFRLKPSGATSIKAYSYVEGDEDWTEICELLSSRDVDANQSAQLYGYVDILQSDESLYADYLKNETSGFLIGIVIEGGTFDGARVTLPWPGDYTPPTQIPELDGSGGNENNAGSGEGGGDSTEGGQRPDLPDVETPPVTTHPPDTSNPPDNSGGSTTPSTPTDTPENGDGTVSPTPPLDNSGGNITPSAPTNTPESGGDTASPTPPSNTSNPLDNNGDSTPTDTPKNEGDTVSLTPIPDPDALFLIKESTNDTPPLAHQRPIKQDSPTVYPPLLEQDNKLLAQKTSDNRVSITSYPTESELGKTVELPVWNKAKPQGQAQEKPNAQTRQTPDSKSRLPAVAVVLLLGGGIVAVAMVGTGSAANGTAGTGAAAKLLTACKNFCKRQ